MHKKKKKEKKISLCSGNNKEQGKCESSLLTLDFVYNHCRDTGWFSPLKHSLQDTVSVACPRTEGGVQTPGEMNYVF